MKIIAMSDMHGDLPQPKSVPPCDVVCIAGDTVPLNIQGRIKDSRQWLMTRFLQWVGELDCRYVILIAGNHDFCMETHKHISTESPWQKYDQSGKLIYLQDESYTIDGVNFYGTPWITGLPRWAFNLNEGDSDVMSRIPDCDVLVTHAPPNGPTGTVLQDRYNKNKDFGSANLRARLMKGGIKVCVSGHIHSGLHEAVKIGDASCWNVSLKDELYESVYPCTEINL